MHCTAFALVSRSISPEGIPPSYYSVHFLKRLNMPQSALYCIFVSKYKACCSIEYCTVLVPVSRTRRSVITTRSICVHCLLVFSIYLSFLVFSPLNLCSKEFAIYLCATCIGFQRSIVPVGVGGVGPLLPLLPLYQVPIFVLPPTNLPEPHPPKKPQTLPIP